LAKIKLGGWLNSDEQERLPRASPRPPRPTPKLHHPHALSRAKHTVTAAASIAAAAARRVSTAPIVARREQKGGGGVP